MAHEFELNEIVSEERFNPLLIDPAAPFTQGYFYGEWQKDLGREVKRFAIISNSKTIGFLQLIKYPLLRGKSYLYAPYGPVIKEFSKELLEMLYKKLMEITKRENAVFTRLDFNPKPNETQEAAIKKFFKTPPLYTYRSSYFQPRMEWILDLKQSKDELLKHMDSKMRYGIRTAEKRGIQIEIVSRDLEKYFNPFYALMEETSDRNRFGLHTKDYYKHIFESSEVRKNAYLVIARYEGKILVIDFMVQHGTMANYVFSGSSNEHRNLMPSYLAQWEAICHAEKLGCTHYNFGGISGGVDARKEWEGLTLFKKRFGGHALIHSTFYDVVANPFWYHLYGARKFIKKFVP